MVYLNSSLASLVSAVFAPVYYLMGDRLQWYAEKPITAALFAMAGLLAWRHRENIQRLLQGKESKLGGKKATATAGSSGSPPSRG